MMVTAAWAYYPALAAGEVIISAVVATASFSGWSKGRSVIDRRK
jgi:hypothetical protein